RFRFVAPASRNATLWLARNIHEPTRTTMLARTTLASSARADSGSMRTRRIVAVDTSTALFRFTSRTIRGVEGTQRIVSLVTFVLIQRRDESRNLLPSCGPAAPRERAHHEREKEQCADREHDRAAGRHQKSRRDAKAAGAGE